MARGFSATRGFGARESAAPAARLQELPVVIDIAPIAERSPDAVKLAVEYRKRAVEIEPKLTSMLMNTAAKFGGVMEGLKDRLKSTDSIARKIDKEVKIGAATTREVAAREMGDMVRHTVSFGADVYTEGMASVLKALQDDGYKLDIRNFWSPDDPYQGVNVNIEKDGVKTELQFHTPESFKVKSEQHDAYDKYRNDNTPKDEKVKLFNSMTAESNKIPVPKNLDKLMQIGKVIKQSV